MKSIGNTPTGGGEVNRSVGSRPTLGSDATARRYRAGDIILGRYKITGELGQGGMGVVYRCFDETGGIDVALKALPPELSHNTIEMEEVRENFRLVEGLHHPNIAAAKTLECDPDTGDYYLIMECVDGINLRQWRKKRANRAHADQLEPAGALPEILPIVTQIAEALDYAHSRKIVHRDVKPSNVMVTAEGAVKVLDFGLAAQIHTSMSRVSRASHGTSGTGPYMAPEQWEGDYQDAATDQYALGVLVYELLAGRCPFESHEVGVLREIALGQPPKPVPDLDAKAWAVLKRALAKKREERFPSCGTFAAALAGKKVRASARRTTRRAAVALVAAAVVAAAALLAHRSYKSYTSHTSQKRAAAQAQAARDAATRAKMAEFTTQAERALASGDLEAAGAAIAELERIGGAPAAATLRGRYESLAGERETNRRYAKASVAYEKARAIDRGQGFGAKLDALELTWREAEAARQGKNWGQALSAYDKTLAESAALVELDGVRQSSAAERTKAAAAEKEAASAGAEADAPAEWTRADRASSRAADEYGNGDFPAAASSWREAAGAFVQAKSRALAVHDYRVRKAAYLTELKTADEALLRQYGGSAWQEVEKNARLGAASANDPAEGSRAYAAALKALPEAVRAAGEARQAARIEAALNSARQAKRTGTWEKVVEHCDAALSLEADNREAQALKREAEQHLKPALEIVAMADGRKVAATVTQGEKTWQTPIKLNLTKGADYTFTVFYKSHLSHTSHSSHWKPATLKLTANWTGTQTHTVRLEEAKGPVRGQPWTSPSTGMEFVWIEKLGMWVGKYEVTNREYRKKSPDHDSKEYKGHSLNGDRQPVVYVSFDDAKAYAQWLTEQDRRSGRLPAGFRYRVPSEKEWVTFAQCGDGREYPWGDNWPPRSGQAGNYSDSASALSYKIDGYNDGYPVTCDVAKSWANPWGLYGVGGNVWEACVADSSGGSFGAWRGASWFYSFQVYLRCSYRYDFFGPSFRYYSYGFRLVLSR